MHTPIMKKVTGDGVTINLAIWEGEGKPIISVHGITANCRSWDVLGSTLSPRHHLIAMDLRGRGRSDKPQSGYSLEHHMRDIVCLMNELKIEKTVIMGHSLGAFISLAFGAHYSDQVDSIILVDGAGKLSQKQFSHVFATIKPALDRLGKVLHPTDDYINLVKSSPFIHPWSPAIEGYYLYELENVAGGVRCNINPDHIQEEAGNVRKFEPDMFYSKVHSNVLILKATEGLVSQDDLLLHEPVVNGMVNKIPHAKRFDVEGVNHYGVVFQLHPKRDRAILDFLEG